MAANRTSVLFLAPVEPWCRENGSSVIIADLVEALAQKPGIDMLPVFLRQPPEGYKKNPPSEDFGVQLGQEGLPRWASVAAAIATGSSPLRMRFANRTVANRVLTAVRARGFVPSVIHVEHLPLVDIGLLLARAFDAPLVYRAHNIETQLWMRRLGIGGRAGNAIEKWLARSEAAAAEACDLTLCISNTDLDWIVARAPRARAEVLPPAIMVERYAANAAASAPAGPPICFVGGLEWTPNEVGLRWFVENALPLVLKEVPNAKLGVLARGAAERSWLTEHPAIEILPPEAEARALYARSRVSIAPLLQGGGVRIKILESFALGCPVVATSIGAEGLELPHLTRTNEPDAFAAACVRLLQAEPDAGFRSRLRQAVNEQHGAHNVADRLVDAWHELDRPVVLNQRVG